jgi:arsenite-transporting ATPase
LRFLLHTGKGGVGKTTLALATAFGAAERGHRVFVLSTDPAHSLGDALGRKLGAGPELVAEGVTAQEVAVLDELDRAWSTVQGWLQDMLSREGEEMLVEELLVLPGMEELVSLRAVREIEATGDYDLCVVDCAPTGATLRMLRFPDVLRFFMQNLFDLERRSARLLRPIALRLNVARWVPPDEVYEAFERLYTDVADVRQILLDGDRTSARLVVNPARVVVDETRRLFAYLSLHGVATDAVLINRVLPDRAAAGYFARWAQREREELERIGRSFPVPLFEVPLQVREPIGETALRELARQLFGDRDPAELFTRSRPIRLYKRGAGTVLAVQLPGVDKAEVDVTAAGGELLVSVRDAQRLIALPESLCGRPIVGVRLRNEVLEVEFAP